ncbi:PaaX family transcriptional regulator C-terminal domain-containing protein [Acrocarpospora corrugata]|uniref:PaaX family transcriptional regulator n=1 Tax=Acrocarpospora corrugata TaxID=35763 RepID=UPI001FE617AD|nr:PaaX family transcriptional regulator C-terminal domain-containing protein [Acrocarpospora corrugata]
MTIGGEDEPAAPSTRPQSLIFSFLGIYALDRGTAISSGSIIDVFARLGVSEEAVRSTLARMVKRNFLIRYRVGRRAYLGLTPHAVAVLRDGRRRIWETGAVNRDWDGTWTVVGFSLPDSRRSTRHDLRSRLIWAGFGPLQSGLWIAPGAKEVTGVFDALDVDDHVTVLTARAFKPTEAADLVAKAFDIEQIARRYRAFLARWDVTRPLPDAPDDLVRQLSLHTDWLQLVRQDPHLPAEHLPADWPAIRAEQVFHTRAEEYERPARNVADGVLDELTP